jgi:hypothetical protein
MNNSTEAKPRGSTVRVCMFVKVKLVSCFLNES